jgi:hypothetical protein
VSVIGLAAGWVKQRNQLQAANCSIQLQCLILQEQFQVTRSIMTMILQSTCNMIFFKTESYRLKLLY